MPTIHPALASVPAVLLAAVAVFYVLGKLNVRNCSAAVLPLLCAIAVCVPLTYLSGYLGSDQASRSFAVPEEIIMNHQAWGQGLLLLTLPLVPLYLLAERAIYHRAAFRMAFAVLLAFAVLVSLYASFLGGELVFKHGAGVSLPGKGE